MFASDLFGEISDHLSVEKINTRKHNSCTVVPLLYNPLF